MKGELPTPLCDSMRSPLSEAAVQRIWRAVDRRRAHRSRPRARFAALSIALAAMALVAATFGLWPRGAPVTARSASDPLALAGGGELRVLEAGAEGPARFDFSDGSGVELSPGARLSTLESTERAYSALLSEGRGVFYVKKGGPRRWSIECGLATVEVVGTRFVIDRSQARVRVEVLEGVVLVRGERVPDRVRRLTAGEALEIGEPSSEAPKPPETPRAPSPKPTTVLPINSNVSYRGLAKRGDFKGAYRALGRAGIARESARGDADTLLLLADIARLSGHPEGAVEPLETLTRKHAADPRAALAAFTLGRTLFDSLGQPARAAAAFQRALDLGLSGPLVEDALARLVEARARSGDMTGARAAFAEYMKRFPNGHRAKDARRWAAAP